MKLRDRPLFVLTRMNFIRYRSMMVVQGTKGALQMPRKSSPLRRSSALFADSSSPLNSLYRQVSRLTALQKLVDSRLPAALRGHLQVASFEEHTLLLISDSAHRAAALRYRERDLVAALRAERAFRALERIRFAIRPGYATPAKRRTVRTLSAAAASQIASAAKYIEDQELRKALIKLSEQPQDQ